MATALLSRCVSGDHLPIIRHEVEVRPKRRRVKNVTWQTEDKLCQVRMFSSDDAPSTSGYMLHTHVSSSRPGNLPPGFEGAMNKRFKRDATSEKSIVVDKPWRSPDKFVLDCSWLVVEGQESTEMVSQQQREIRVLEAVYPRSSSIPLSPAEPHEDWENIDDSLIPQIPSVPVEDEDEIFKEGSSLGFSISALGEYGAAHPYSFGGEAEEKNPAHQQLDANRVVEPSLCVAEEATSRYDLATASLSNADCSIIAAAADTNASLKSLKGNSLVDHELLFEILSNPVLMKVLLSSSQDLGKSIEESLVNFSNRILANGNGVCNEENIKGNTCLAAFLQPNIQGVSKVDVSFRGDILQQGVETSEVRAHLDSGEVDSRNGSCSMLQTEDLSHIRTGSLGHSIGAQGMTNLHVFERPFKDFEMKLQAAAPAVTLAGQPNSFGGLVHKHVAENNNAQAMLGMKDTTSDLYGERLRMMRAGPQPELSARGNGLSESCIQNHQRGDVAVPNPDVARSRPRKPCLYFNTPKGCRNGASCGFLHELRTEN